MPEGSKPAKSPRSIQRQQRLAAELRANLGKRKAQARARAAGGEPAKPDKPGRNDVPA
jgi:hypothetical protein